MDKLFEVLSNTSKFYLEQSWDKEYPEDGVKFSGKWVRNWFSNMAPSEFELDGKVWKSVENYYQAMKTLDPAKQEEIRLAPINKSKQLGRLVEVREDWENIKMYVMLKGLYAKFSLEPFRTQLLETEDKTLVEWNNWGDKIWGATINNKKGKNLLGRALENIRYILKKEDNNK